MLFGVKKEIIIKRFLTGMPNRFDTAKGDVRLQAVLLDIDSATGKANSMERISVKLKEKAEAVGDEKRL